MALRPARNAPRTRAISATAFEFEQSLRHAPTLSFRADPVFLGNADIVEKELVDFMLARHADDRLDLYPRRTHVGDQECNSLLPPPAVGGTHKHEYPVRVMRVGGPQLGAIDDIGVAVV